MAYHGGQPWTVCLSLHRPRESLTTHAAFKYSFNVRMRGATSNAGPQRTTWDSTPSYITSRSLASITCLLPAWQRRDRVRTHLWLSGARTATTMSSQLGHPSKRGRMACVSCSAPSRSRLPSCKSSNAQAGFLRTRRFVSRKRLHTISPLAEPLSLPSDPHRHRASVLDQLDLSSNQLREACSGA